MTRSPAARKGAYRTHRNCLLWVFVCAVPHPLQVVNPKGELVATIQKTYATGNGCNACCRPCCEYE